MDLALVLLIVVDEISINIRKIEDIIKNEISQANKFDII